MNALFADTFHWIALSDTADSSHHRALDIASKRAGWTVITTDEVLAEFLTFFATAPEPMRRKAVINAQRILGAPDVRVVPHNSWRRPGEFGEWHRTQAVRFAAMARHRYY
jgi:hypothetical protein